ncbi:MAG: response regulator [Polyangiaceae bacterium]
MASGAAAAVERKEEETDRLGGARADFVGNLGRRVADLATTLKNYRKEPASGRLRDELRRRVHALAAGARLLRFGMLAEELKACEALLEEIASKGELEDAQAVVLASMFERMPQLAWGQQPSPTPPPASGPGARAVPAPRATLPGLGIGELEGVELTPSPALPVPPAPPPPSGATSIGASLSPVITPPSPSASPGAPSPTPARSTMPAFTASGAFATPSERGAPPSPRNVDLEASVSMRGVPQTALVVGAAPLADLLTNAIDATGREPDLESAGFEVERTEELETAIDLARALAPDVAVIDADASGARQLIEALLSDPLTEPVPVVVVGTWARPDEAAPFVALGVARALPKPVSPASLRRACIEAIASYGRREVHREPLGEVSLDELGHRLAEELRRGLCDAAEAKGRGARVDLGEGSEVLAALWGAVARIRDLVTIESKGVVRYSGHGPEGALPVAAWIGAQDGSTMSARALSPEKARTGGTARLDGMSVLVVDDDPAVIWFLAGVLREAGAEVHEAHDGARALDIAYRTAPDLVISDVVMPGLDGFALCRALKRDLVLRDVPVILLSWKEDLLQRVRELGADADGYLRKEASAAAIVQRVREVMRPRRRVAERLAAGGEVRGRLDGLTTRTLLGLACQNRPWSTLTVRDASFLYEVEIQDGRPARATRTATDGTFQRGPTVLAALLGVGSGRFVLTPVPAPESGRGGRPDLEGRLSEQLFPPVAAARAAQRLLSGAQLMQIDRVTIAEERVAAYLGATPEPARSLMRAFAAGASPRLLITSGQAAARLVEDVLCDAAAHGAVTGVTSRDGIDVLGPAIERELAVLTGPGSACRWRPAGDARRAHHAADGRHAGAARRRALAADADADAGAADDADADADADAADAAASLTPPPPTTTTTKWWCPATTKSCPAPPSRRSASPPSGLEDEEEGLWPFRRSLVSQEPPSFTRRSLGHAHADRDARPRAAAPTDDDKPAVTSGLGWTHRARHPPWRPPPLRSPSTAAPRRASPRAGAAGTDGCGVASLATMALDGETPPHSPRARVARAARSVPPAAAPPAEPDPSMPGLPAIAVAPLTSLGSLTPPPVSPDVLGSLVRPAPPAEPQRPARPAARRPNDDVDPEPEPTPSRPPRARAVPRPSAYLPSAPPAPPRDRRGTYLWVAFAASACVFAVAMRWNRQQQDALPPPALPGVAAPTEATAAAPTGAATAAPSAEGGDDRITTEELAMRAEDKVGDAEGMLEVVAGSSDTIYVDGKELGSGPVQKVALAARAKPYEVRVKLRGDEERVRFVAVKAGKLVRRARRAAVVALSRLGTAGSMAAALASATGGCGSCGDLDLAGRRRGGDEQRRCRGGAAERARRRRSGRHPAQLRDRAPRPALRRRRRRPARAQRLAVGAPGRCRGHRARRRDLGPHDGAQAGAVVRARRADTPLRRRARRRRGRQECGGPPRRTDARQPELQPRRHPHRHHAEHDLARRSRRAHPDHSIHRPRQGGGGVRRGRLDPRRAARRRSHHLWRAHAARPGLAGGGAGEHPAPGHRPARAGCGALPAAAPQGRARARGARPAGCRRGPGRARLRARRHAHHPAGDLRPQRR